MRKLLFRAWDNNKQEWYGDSCEHSLTFKDFSLFGECTFFCMPSVDYLQYLVVDQYTGMQDEKGNNIYEGDIIKYTQHHFNTDYSTTKYKAVKWVYDKWNVNESNARISNIVVIGNIHENPELLEHPIS